jgi:hypothetical protein
MTHIITKPSERVNWAVLLQGAQGSGKSYIAFVLQLLIGSNAKLLATSALKGTFTAWAQGAIVNIVEEIRIAGDNKWEILDRLKAFIGNDEIPIEEKGVDHKTVPNFTSYFFLTNHPNAIPLTDEDRRYCVLSGAIQSLDALNAALGGPVGVEQYFTKLFDESKRRPDVLLYFFMTREISSDFKPKGRAPITEGIGQMIAYAVSEDTETVLDFITKYNNGVINEKVLDITLLSKLSAPIFFGGKCLPATSKLKNTLLDLGYRRVKDRVNIPGTKTKHTVWFKEPFTEKLAIDDFKAFYADPKNASHSI